ncbi:DUF4224 domain-containing protein [Actinobacillus pleuropneumoniae]|uniref:DUF4224 domain-containing protein n=1 Tax=Actinobacillus pleuropneumoniae TaxID=715 RepID=UPI003B984B67
MNIYQDFLALEELQFLTGRKQKKMIIEQLNKMGIPFVKNGNGFPIVRRDYASRTKNKNLLMNMIGFQMLSEQHKELVWLDPANEKITVCHKIYFADDGNEQAAKLLNTFTM